MAGLDNPGLSFNRPFRQNPLFSQVLREIDQEKQRDLECQRLFVTAVIDGNKKNVKMRWDELCIRVPRSDLFIFLNRIKTYIYPSFLSDEYMQWLAKWIGNIESKLEKEEAFSGQCRKIQKRLLLAAGRLDLEDLQAVIEQIKKIHADEPDLSASFFQSEWKEAQECAQDHADSEEKREVLHIIDDALERIESKKTLLAAIGKLRLWNFKELSERVKKIYEDQKSLFPCSHRSISSDWESAKQCIDSHLHSDKRKQALSILSDAEQQLHHRLNGQLT